MRDPDVLIVGAGPAGLAAAAELARRGIRDILLIDRDDAPGGLPRFCAHPGFGIGYLAIPRSGPAFAASMLREAGRHGVRVMCATTMISLDEGPTVTMTGPEIGYQVRHPKAVVLASGIREANRGNRQVPGDRPTCGLLTTGLLQQMVARRIPFPADMRSLVVVGTEHVSFSAIWTAKHAGLKVRMMLDEQPVVSSFRLAGWLGRLAGIDIRLGTRLAAVHAKGDRVCEVTIERGGKSEAVACDGVVFTAGWIPETGALLAGPAHIDKTTGAVAVDAQGGTSLAGVFAAGNIRHPLKASGMCARQGRHVGIAVAEYLSGMR